MLGSDGFSPEGCQKHRGKRGEAVVCADMERGEDKVGLRVYWRLSTKHLGAITRSAAQPRLTSRINIGRFRPINGLTAA